MAETYTDLLNQLNREVNQQQPDDVLQFCAGFFNRKLDEERRRLRQPQFQQQQHHAEQQQPQQTQQQSQQAPATRSRGSEGGPTDVSGNGASLFASSSPFGQGQLHDSRDRSPSPSSGAPSGQAAGGPGYSFPQSDTAASHFDDLARGRTTQTANGYPLNYNATRRTSVSAESMLPSADNSYQKIVIPKSTSQLQRIDAAISKNLLFKNLDEEQLRDVLDAMSEKKLTAAGSVIIKQGDVGDFFYVVEAGSFDIYVRGQDQQSDDSQGRGFGTKVASAQAGGSFGELALMYNAPRAATVVSNAPNCVVWALDRMTFRRILMENTSRKRKMYESFLETVNILRALEVPERQKIADSLDTCVFDKGAVVIRQGDVGEQFFMIESGEADVIRDGEGVIARLKKGDYFGETALITDAPRNATIQAATRLKVATLGKRAFVRLLGPVIDIMKREERTQ